MVALNIHSSYICTIAVLLNTDMPQGSISFFKLRQCNWVDIILT